MASLGRVMRNAGLTTSTTLFDSTRQHISSGVLVDAAGASCGQSAARAGRASMDEQERKLFLGLAQSMAPTQRKAVALSERRVRESDIEDEK
jgi:hypothetical protein